MDEVKVVQDVSQIQAFAELMQGFYPEHDEDLKGKDMREFVRRCGEAIGSMTDKLLHDLDL